MGMTPADRPSIEKKYVTLINDAKVHIRDYINYGSFFIYHGECIFYLEEEEEYDRNKIVIIDSEKYVVIASAILLRKIGGSLDDYKSKVLVFLDDCPDFEFLRPAEKSSTEKWDEEEQRMRVLAGLEEK